MKNVSEIINKAITCVSETESSPNQSTTQAATISIASNRQIQTLQGDKLKKAYLWVVERLSKRYGPYRVAKEGPWYDYLIKMEAEHVKKTIAYIESGVSEYKVFAPTAPQFYELWQTINRKKTPEDANRDKEQAALIEEGRRIVNDYLLTMAASCISGAPPHPVFIQTEASLRDYFNRSGMHFPEEIKNLVMDKIRPLNEEVISELKKRYWFWMCHIRGVDRHLDLK